MEWSQKANVRWLNEGDRNTSFFHATTIYRRQRNQISRLQDHNGEWITNDTQIDRSFFLHQGPLLPLSILQAIVVALLVMTTMMELDEETVAESKSKPIWERKNLYLTFKGNTRILGIKPSDDTTETADLVTNCDLVKEKNYLVSMGLLFIDSKVYMVGG
ncbi:hypothetical protein LINPERHAP1_LOCUS34801 [Linum perenne]